MIETTKLKYQENIEWSKIWDKHAPGKNEGRNKSVFGDFFEGIVAKYLVEGNISSLLHSYRGLIKSGSRCSPQVDLIIASDTEYECEFTRNSVVPADSVKAIIEVKSFVDKPTYGKLREYFATMKEFLPHAKKLLVIGTLARPIEESDLQEQFDFCDGFYIMYRKKARGEEIEDYGNQREAFVQTLRNLKTI